MKIIYFEDEGKLKFLLGKDSHIVPQKIIKKGNEAIRKHAENIAKEYLEKTEKYASEMEKLRKNPDFPIEINHNGVILKGKIVSAENYTLRVKLLKPLTGKASRMVGVTFGDVMSGCHIFDKLSTGIKFSDSAIRIAERLLISIFEEEKRKLKNVETIKMANLLNKIEGISAKESESAISRYMALKKFIEKMKNS